MRVGSFKGGLLSVLILSSLIVLSSLLHSGPISVNANPDNIVIVILHTNDIHSHLLAEGANGGSAYIASIVDNEREQNPGRVLLLDAGDIVDGDPIGDLFYGESTIWLMNTMGYDAMAVGNHDLGHYGGDFHYSAIQIENDPLMDLKGIAKFPMLAANVQINNLDNSKQFAPYVIENIDNVKIGIIGVTTNAYLYDNITVTNPENAVRQCINKIENQVDIIIALTHLGEGSDRNLASHVENINIIIGGHSHTVMWTPDTVGKTKIVQAGAYGDYVGRIELDINAENHENYTFQYTLIPVTHPPLAENQVIAEIVENYNSIISPIVDRKIGYTENALSYNVTIKMVAESLKESTGADVGIYSGDIRDTINAGPITVRRIDKVLPYPDRLMLTDLGGHYLKNELSHGQVAGAFKDNSQWYLENGDLIKDNEYYRVAVNDYGVTQHVFTYGENTTCQGLCRDAFINYIKEVFPFSIYINGNDNFTSANGVSGGSGTENDPYIIENWDINAENVNGIEIRNTTAYFVIRNCYVHGDQFYENYGIFFRTVINGILENNIVENSSSGIYIDNYSTNNIISGNTVKINYNGIYLESSSYNTLTSNICGGNHVVGIELINSNNNAITNNTCNNNYYWGIYLNSSSGNTITNNTCTTNRYDGVCSVFSCSQNIITNNKFENNERSGIYFTLYSTNNYVYHNNFVNNASQAYDYGSNYWDNGYPSGGNYWSDYAGIDNYHGENQNILGGDGIGDTPYIIPSNNNRDQYPLMPPPTGTASIRPATGAAPFLWGICKATLTVNLKVYDGDNLRLRFLATDNKTVENEAVIWTRTTLGQENVILTNLVISHPDGVYVTRGKLVLTDNTGAIILDNMAWYRVVQDDWGDRISWIVINWALHTLPDQDKLGDEISTIVLNWALIPSGPRDQHDFSQ